MGSLLSEKLGPSFSLPSFALPSQAKELIGELGTAQDNESLTRILGVAQRSGATRAIVEHEYVDADYRDEFINFYAGTFRDVRDKCSRVHLYADDDGVSKGQEESYLGYVIVRPLAGQPVGRTLFSPPREVVRFVSCVIDDMVRPFGRERLASGFPFMEQDTQLGVCAHAAAWSVSYYHHRAHGTPRTTLSQIANAAHDRVSFWRSLPSDGLSKEQIHASLEAIDLKPIVYDVADLNRLEPKQSPQQVVCRYLNSGFPVILAYGEHMVVLIGYGKDYRGKIFFVRSNDLGSPYEVVRGPGIFRKWEHLIVPVPGRIYMSADVAEYQARMQFARMLGLPENATIRTRLAGDYSLSAKAPDHLMDPAVLRLRTYATRGSHYKCDLDLRGVPPEIVQLHSYTSASNWVWVVELQDPAVALNSSSCVLGEIVIDATSHKNDPHFLFGHLPGSHYRWDQHRSPKRTRFVESESGDIPSIPFYMPYSTGSAIHDAPSGYRLRANSANEMRANSAVPWSSLTDQTTFRLEEV